MKLYKISLCLIILFISGCIEHENYQIIIPAGAERAEILAAKEVRRYIYLRTNEFLPIVQTDSSSQIMTCIIIAIKNQELLSNIYDLHYFDYKNLGEQEFILQSYTDGRRRSLFIIGGGSAGVLYGAYQFAEEIGIRFYLDGDVVPDHKQPLTIPVLNNRSGPLFELRGILPFHDFPEGPDWWNPDDYKAIIGQLPKLKMNFIGFHTYPEHQVYPSGSYQAEPLVWIGPEEDIREDGTVTSAYPVLHFNTGDNTWGYLPGKTSDYHCGAAQLFEQDYYGAEYMMNTSKWPRTPDENIRIVNRVGAMLKDAFSFAEQLEVKTCLGTETPLIIPDSLRIRLRENGLMSGSDTVKYLYKGVFQRITNTHPLDFYWLWIPEGWTWNDVSEEQVRRTEEDLLKAVAAAEELNVPFSLATCGWVLGPPGDRTRFDQILPENIPFSCINREVGFSPVDPSFANLAGRSGWAIPWLEDDPALISPQLWAGRMRKDAVDALKYGCDGLMGIHWRTKILGPNVSALASAAWKQEEWAEIAKDSSLRDLPAVDFYQDWAKIQFGPEVSERIAQIFVSLDGGPLFNREHHQARQANLFRTSDWQKGPGGVIMNSQPWDTVKKNFDFVDSLLVIRSGISGEGNLERYDYWLNTFLFARSTARFGCMMGQIDDYIFRMRDNLNESQIQKFVELNILPMRIEAARIWEEMMYYFLQTVSTTGELGTIANLEQHNLGLLQVLNKHDSLIIHEIGRELPRRAALSMEYRGPLKIIVPTRRNLLEQGEDLNLKVILLSGESVNKAFFCWRYLDEAFYNRIFHGIKRFNKIPLEHVNRGVYKVILSSEILMDRDFEYYIEVDANSGSKTYYPATAPEICQTVVIIPGV